MIQRRKHKLKFSGKNNEIVMQSVSCFICERQTLQTHYCNKNFESNPI